MGQHGLIEDSQSYVTSYVMIAFFSSATASINLPIYPQ